MANNKKFVVKNGLVAPNAEVTGLLTANTVSISGGDIINLSTFSANTAQFLGTDAITISTGNTTQRPANAEVGMIRYNNELETFEGYSAGEWGSIGGGAEAGGAIVVNQDVATQSYTIANGENGFSVGPMTVNDGVTITVSPGQRWVII